MLMQNIAILGLMVKNKIASLFTDEKGEVNIVAIVVLIGIAVLLALIFKDNIETLLDSLFGTIEENAVSAVGGSSD